MNNDQILHTSDIIPVNQDSFGVFELAVDKTLKAMADSINGIHQIKEQFIEMRKELKSYGARIDSLEKKFEKAEEALKAQVLQEQLYDGYVTLTEFGELMTPVISSHRVGRLFRVVGLAEKRREGRTKPYHKMIREKYAQKVTAANGRVYYVWHHGMCSEFIDQWMEKHGLYYEFKGHKFTEEREKFIDRLFWDYVAGLGAAAS